MGRHRSLPDWDEAVILLRYKHGWTYTKIASLLQLTKSQVAEIIRRFRKNVPEEKRAAHVSELSEQLKAFKKEAAN